MTARIRIAFRRLRRHPALQDRLAGVALSFVCHLALLIGSLALVQPAEFGMASGYGGIDVQLIAAPPGIKGEGEAAELPPPHDLPAQTETADQALSASADEVTLPGEAPAPPAEAGGAEVVGDGSSPVPGKDATTLFMRGGGGASEGRPGHLRNPIPPYPPEARRLRQEGQVLLRVQIDRRGYPVTVALQESSGFPLLDASALKTVRRWRFRPARVAGVPVDSVAQLPIRFVLHGLDEYNRLSTP